MQTHKDIGQTADLDEKKFNELVATYEELTKEMAVLLKKGDSVRLKLQKMVDKKMADTIKQRINNS